MLLRNFLNLLFNLLDGEGVCFGLTLKSFFFNNYSENSENRYSRKIYIPVGSISVFI